MIYPGLMKMRTKIPAINAEANSVIFEVQSLFTQGTGTACITGQVASNIHECVSVAWSIINHKYYDLKNLDVHVHFTDGSFYKVGTSCGLAVIISMLDSLGVIKTPYRNVLISGEIDLYGNVYGVGGVKEKTRDLNNKNIDLIILPKENYGETENNYSPIKYLENVDEFVREYASEKINF